MVSLITITALILGILLLVTLILYFKLNAFISLLIASIITGLLAGLDAIEIMHTVQKGMGSTLGFVATVVGLGAIFGGILEQSGGAQSITNMLLNKLGKDRAPLAMMLAGFIVAIPVFFDVAFIILIPVLYALQRNSGKSLLIYAIPLLAGLAITHAFIPPTPGPVAVANIINVDLGAVISIGFIVGLPTALICGLWFGKKIGNKIFIKAPDTSATTIKSKNLPSASLIATIIMVPIILILSKTAIDSELIQIKQSFIKEALLLIGHPFVALIIANLLAWYGLGIKRGYAKEEMMRISNASFSTAGSIILLTGAGGVYKQILVDTEIGLQLANIMKDWGIPIILFAFIAAALVRLLQGSSTVAMITAAGLVAPLLTNYEGSSYQLACIVIAIASGASIFSHVNDSGFWLVGQYLGIDERTTFKSWSLMTLILALCGFSFAFALYYIIA